MKDGDHTYDYVEEEYDVVPDWVSEFREDRLSDGYVISRRGGEWIMTSKTGSVDLEDKR